MGALRVKLVVVLEPQDYTVLVAHGFSAYSPDVPGCVATGATRESIEREMRDAVAFHLEGPKDEGLEVPRPHSSIWGQYTVVEELQNDLFGEYGGRIKFINKLTGPGLGK